MTSNYVATESSVLRSLRRWLPHGALLLGALTGTFAYITYESFSPVKLFILLHLVAISAAVLGYMTLHTSRPGFESLVIRRHVFRILAILLVFMFGSLVLSLHQSTFFRDVSFHYFSASIVALLMILIIAMEKPSRLAIWGILSAILVLAFVNGSSTFLLNLGPSWYDGYFHQDASIAILQTGYVTPELGPYADFPAYHIGNAILMGLSDADPVLSLAIWHAIILLIPLTAFIIGRDVFHSERWGLLASLLSIVTLYPNTPLISPHVLTLALVLLAASLIIRTHQGGTKAKELGVVFLIGVSLLVMHPGAGAIVLSLILLADLAFRLVYRAGRPTIHVFIYALVVTAYLIFVAVQSLEWSLTSLLVRPTPPPPFSQHTPSITLPYIAELTFTYLPFVVFTFLFGLASLFILLKSRPTRLNLLVLVPPFLLAPNLILFLVGRPTSQFLVLVQYPVFMALVIPALIRVRRGVLLVAAVTSLIALSQFSLTVENDNGNFFLQAEAPQFVTYAGQQTAALKPILQQMAAETCFVTDYASGSAHWGTPHFTESGPVETLSMESFSHSHCVVVFNPAFILRWQAASDNPELLVQSVRSYLNVGSMDVLYSSGGITIYQNK